MIVEEIPQRDCRRSEEAVFEIDERDPLAVDVDVAAVVVRMDPTGGDRQAGEPGAGLMDLFVYEREVRALEQDIVRPAGIQRDHAIARRLQARDGQFAMFQAIEHAGRPPHRFLDLRRGFRDEPCRMPRAAGAQRRARDAPGRPPAAAGVEGQRLGEVFGEHEAQRLRDRRLVRRSSRAALEEHRPVRGRHFQHGFVTQRLVLAQRSDDGVTAFGEVARDPIADLAKRIERVERGLGVCDAVHADAQRFRLGREDGGRRR